MKIIISFHENKYFLSWRKMIINYKEAYSWGFLQVEMTAKTMLVDAPLLSKEPYLKPEISQKK